MGEYMSLELFYFVNLTSSCSLISSRGVEVRIPFVSHDIPDHDGAPQYQVWLQKVAYKHSAEWEQIRVTSITSLTPEDTTVLSLL